MALLRNLYKGSPGINLLVQRKHIHHLPRWLFVSSHHLFIWFTTDTEFVYTFILTYPSFTTACELLMQLERRFHLLDATEEERKAPHFETNLRIIQVRWEKKREQRAWKGSSLIERERRDWDGYWLLVSQGGQLLEELARTQARGFCKWWTALPAVRCHARTHPLGSKHVPRTADFQSTVPHAE